MTGSPSWTAARSSRSTGRRRWSGRSRCRTSSLSPSIRRCPGGELGSLAAVQGVDLPDDGPVRLSSSDAAATMLALTAAISGQAGRRLVDLEIRTATLEDVFLALTGRELRD